MNIRASLEAAGIFALAAALGFLLHGCARPAKGAPVPQRKPKVQAQQASLIPGTWDLYWNSGLGRATFHAGGGYECRWCGQDWVGTWKIKGDDLTVSEILTPGPKGPPVGTTWFVWTATLVPGTRRGKLSFGGNFELKPPKVTD